MTVKRTASDPGHQTQTTQQIIQFQSEHSFTLTGVSYQSEDAGYLSPSLQDEVFNQVQDNLLLQGVDAQQLANIQFQNESLLPEQNNQHLQDIAALENYAALQESVVQSPSYQSSHSVNQDLQAVLNSPLPESLAEFSTYHSSNTMDIESPGYQTHSPAQYTNSPHTSLTTQSPLQSPLIRHDSPGFAYPTPPASHEGQSPCFSQNTIHPLVSPKQEFGQVTPRDLDEPPQVSSPLSAAFFTSTMSSSAAVEEALEEVLPGETIPADDLYPSLTNSPPPPPSPISIGLTPIPSPLPNVPTSSVQSPHPTFAQSSNPQSFSISPHIILQSHMMPNSDDPLLSSSPKDFVPKKKIEINGLPIKVISSNGLIDLHSTSFAGILVDTNGELKFIQTAGSTFQTKNILVAASTPLLTTQNALIKDEDGKSHIRVHKVFKTVQAIPTKQVVQKPKLDTVKQEENADVFLSPTT